MAICGDEIHLNDIGTSFRANLNDCGVATDLNGYTVLNMIFSKPDQTTVTKPATIVGVPDSGIIEYVTVDGDLDQIGSWKVQGYIELPTGKWHTDIEKFKVYSNLV